MELTLKAFQELIEFSAYAFTGWVVSWVVFFILLPFMIRVFGKARGAAVNYGLSWVVMVVVILGLEFGLEKKDLFDELEPTSKRF